MALPAPAFEIGNVAYLRQSALRGQLNHVYIAAMSHNGSQWVYNVGVSRPQYSNPLDFGERRRVTMALPNAPVFAESELMTYCTALEEAIAYHQRSLLELQARYSGACGNGTSS